jgi:hypothetical protein
MFDFFELQNKKGKAISLAIKFACLIHSVSTAAANFFAPESYPPKT